MANKDSNNQTVDSIIKEAADKVKYLEEKNRTLKEQGYKISEPYKALNSSFMHFLGCRVKQLEEGYVSGDVPIRMKNIIY